LYPSDKTQKSRQIYVAVAVDGGRALRGEGQRHILRDLGMDQLAKSAAIGGQYQIVIGAQLRKKLEKVIVHACPRKGVGKLFVDRGTHLVGKFVYDILFRGIIPVIRHAGNAGFFGQIGDGDVVVVLRFHQLNEGDHNAFLGQSVGFVSCTHIQITSFCNFF
jgi:hypothetical protein